MTRLAGAHVQLVEYPATGSTVLYAHRGDHHAAIGLWSGALLTRQSDEILDYALDMLDHELGRIEREADRDSCSTYDPDVRP